MTMEVWPEELGTHVLAERITGIRPGAICNLQIRNDRGGWRKIIGIMLVDWTTEGIAFLTNDTLEFVPWNNIVNIWVNMTPKQFHEAFQPEWWPEGMEKHIQPAAPKEDADADDE